MFQQNNPTLFTTIAYHVSWPGTDPFYGYNVPDVTTRRGYYGVNAVPYMAVDGNYAGSWQSTITSHGNLSSPLEIVIDGTYNYLNGDGFLDIDLYTETGVSGIYRLHVVLVEDDLYYAGSNGYPDHENVMRDMFPSASGLSMIMEANEHYTERIDFHVPEAVILDNSRLVVFVQANDHSVLNAATIRVADFAPVNIPLLYVIDSEMMPINDDGDGKVNPGEEAHFAVTIENACDWVDAEDVTGVLSSTNPYVTIIDGEADYDLIVSCDFIENSNDLFHFSVSPEAPNIEELEFELTLTANQGSDAPYETTLPLSYSMNLFQLNFPIEMSQPIAGGNAVIDLDGDGTREVIFGSEDSSLHVLTLDGAELAGFPFTIPNKIQGSPAIADVDNDGDLEVVFSGKDGGVYLVHHDGTGSALTFASNYLLATPALADLDDDGDLEIVVGGWGYDLLAIHHDGTPLAGFPKILTLEKMSSAAALADINEDGVEEIIIGTWSDKLHVFDISGNELPGFPVDVEDDIKAAPVVTDLDGDNQMEILVTQDEGVLTAISPTGDILWTHDEASSGIRTAPAVADFDGDGDREVVITSLDGFITIMDKDGVDLPGWPGYLGTASYSSPVIADLDGDGVSEIIMGTDGEVIYAFHLNGDIVADFPLEVEGAAKGTATIDDLDQDGNLEIVIGTTDQLVVVDIKAASALGTTWHTDRGDYQRTGTFLHGFVVATQDAAQLPKTLDLAQNFPNPFNPTTKLAFAIPEAGYVTLSIFDLRGQLVTQLVDASYQPGYHSVVWNGMDAQNRPADAGVYFARIQAGGSEQSVKMLLLK